MSVTLEEQSAVSVDAPDAGEHTLFADSADSLIKSKDSSNVVTTIGPGVASSLATTGSPVVISGGAPPTAGQVMTALSATTGAFRTPGTYLKVTSVKVGPTSYTAAWGELVLVDVSGGAVTVNMPTAIGNVNSEIGVKLTTAATNPCTIDGFGAQTIDGSLTLVLNTNFEWAVLKSEGANLMQFG